MDGRKPILISFIRTLTVGSGFSPDLLVLLAEARSARGLPETILDTTGGEFHPALRMRMDGMHSLFPSQSSNKPKQEAGAV